ncbi:MAG: hypothetical protein AMXMBFR58_18970 [Phycisphaerae bacterium]
MVNLGLIRRAWLEMRGPTIAFGLAAMVVSTMIHFALPRFQKSLEAFQLPASRLMNLNNLRSAMLGTDVSNAAGREIAAGVAWSHPFFLALVFAHIITVCTRVPAGEVDKGTMDVLLGLPVSRLQLFVSETIAAVGTSCMVIVLSVIGSRIGNSMAPEGMTPDLGRVVMVAAVLMLLVAAVGAIAMLFSTITDRRMRAVAAVLMVVVASLLLNYLGLIWEPAKKAVFLSLLNYYRPIGPLGQGAWPLRDMAVLGGIAGAVWLAAGAWFSRRDLSTT